MSQNRTWAGYGWGDRVEWWTSDTEGENWEADARFDTGTWEKWQNVKFVSDGKGETIPGLLLFYGWEEIEGPVRLICGIIEKGHNYGHTIPHH